MAPLRSTPRPPPGRPGLRAALLGALLFTAAGPAAAVSPAAPAAPGAPAAGRRAVCVRGACFDAEIAVTEAERARGLMHRNALPRDSGMLFVFPEEGMHRFWMKNTLIPLDMLFIDGDGKIVKVVQRTVPQSTVLISSDGPVRAVLELNGGTAARLGIAVGDRVRHPVFEAQR